MKKIVGTSVAIIVELLIGTLFLVGLFISRTGDSNVAVVENNNLSKMAEAVNIMFDTKQDDVFLVKVEKDEDKKSEDEDKAKEEDNKKEEVIEELKVDRIVEEKKEEVVVKSEEPKYIQEEPVQEVIKTYTGTLTGYGPDCSGCSGNTASGYYVGNTITYNDSTYGTVRIVAADKSIPFYSIVRISNVPGMDTITAIVLDTGGAVGFGKATLFDLLFASESGAMNKVYNVKFEILRWGGA